ncbi:MULTISPECIES: hypothetical protein [Pseudomonas]|jgi:hypothetical protein|uniref:Lipoprotein n=2 Tax=Pseudomonas TaxID=286 RepID=A0A7M2J7M3_PSEFL|nr:MULTISPECIES: hypothetical protein [Pseudomonas]DAQ46465.1 MAG TPA: lipoprotein [Caudoviricetes sp.]AHC32908.1 hypothetical protein U771_01740 [Pseudomonas sp. TKP]MBL1308953.1 hypothetical protein [Pseudomonas sp.]PMX16207.1 hypothetical protein C1Y25_09020 [Pseudomonas sp. MPBC4-3]PMX49009.1 hypothetical protein C1Y20_08315 [Pseudomonas sp. FW301-21B01]
MKRTLSLILLTIALGACSTQKPANDPALVGTWKGLRTQTDKCQFLSWTTHLKPDGRFTITFFRDVQQTQAIQTEQGTWSAVNGKNELRTDGVRMPDVYTYQLVDADTVRYVSVAAGPSGDCQEDYAFTERRLR